MTKKKRCPLWGREGRPPKDNVRVERMLPDGTWIPDDGKRGIAFSGQDSRFFPYAITADIECECFLDWEKRKTCPRELAAERTIKKYQCSNGRRFERSYKRKT